MTHKVTLITAALSISLLGIGLDGCDKGDNRTAGQKVNDAMDTAGQKTADAMDKAGEKLGEATDKTKDAVSNAADKASDKMDSMIANSPSTQPTITVTPSTRPSR